MSPRTIIELVQHQPPLLHDSDRVEDAVRRLLGCDLPALPVVGEDERYAGIFGEREVMTALFPGYLGQLKRAAFVPRSIDEALELREEARDEPVGKHMHTEHVEVGPDFSDTQVADTFLHHRVLIVPVVDDGRVEGIITRHDFFRAVAERFIGGGD
jgi:CBS domain-containing protein